eukprot:238891-Lingulodinium_polyedra.AAC.1
MRIDVPDSAAPGMICEAAPKFEIGAPAVLTLKSRQWRLVTIDGIRAHVTLGYLPFEVASHARNVPVVAANLLPS